MTAQKILKTTMGNLYLVASDRGLRGVYFKKQAIPLLQTAIIDQADLELSEYF